MVATAAAQMPNRNLGYNKAVRAQMSDNIDVFAGSYVSFIVLASLCRVLAILLIFDFSVWLKTISSHKGLV